jgi:hypothetical protein
MSLQSCAARTRTVRIATSQVQRVAEVVEISPSPGRRLTMAIHPGSVEMTLKNLNFVIQRLVKCHQVTPQGRLGTWRTLSEPAAENEAAASLTKARRFPCA